MDFTELKIKQKEEPTHRKAITFLAPKSVGLRKHCVFSCTFTVS